MDSPPPPPPRRDRSTLTVFFDALVLDRAISDLLRHTMRDSGLTAMDYALYSAISDTPGVSPSELAAMLGSPRATMTDWLRTVEGRGHATRERSPEDGRRWCVRLTPSGARAHRAAMTAFGEAYVAFLRHHGPTEELSRAMLDAAGAARAALAGLESSRDGSIGAEGGT